MIRERSECAVCFSELSDVLLAESPRHNPYSRASITLVLSKRTVTANGAFPIYYSSHLNLYLDAHSSRVRRVISGKMSALATTRPSRYNSRMHYQIHPVQLLDYSVFPIAQTSRIQPMKNPKVYAKNKQNITQISRTQKYPPPRTPLFSSSFSVSVHRGTGPLSGRLQNRQCNTLLTNSKETIIFEIGNTE